MRPDALTFPHEEGTGYVHWMGKGVSGQQEWVCRMYGQDNTEARANRTSSYLFNLAGGLGAGVYVQEPVTAGAWIHYVITISTSGDREDFYKNGVWKDTAPFQNSAYLVHPQNGTAPVRIGTRDLASYFQGAIDDIRFYNRVLTAAEVQELYTDEPAPPTPTATATPSPTATPRPTNTSTATSTPRPTSTATSTSTTTPRPTNTATPRPTATSTATARPRPTVTSTPTISTTGWYQLVNRNSGKCVDARSSGTANGTVVQQYTCNTTNAQQVQFQPVSGGYFRIGNRNNSAQVFDVTSASTADGASVILKTYAGATEQQWQPIAEAGSYWHLVARRSGKCLHVHASETADSVPLEQWTCNGTQAESFTLQPR
jgi:Ricin-type beta-trefoil lectin domain/Concanavalin A-like lectin/glucanases superfamily